MSRHQAVKKMIQTQSYYDDEEDDIEEVEEQEEKIDEYHESNFSPEELLNIKELEFMFDKLFTRKEVIDILYDTEGDVDQAREQLSKLMDKKQQQKKKKKQQQQQQQQQLQPPSLVKQQSSQEQGQKSKNQFQIDFNLEKYNNQYPSIKYKNQQQQLPQNQMNVIIVGHVDTGKSTILGKLLHELKVIHDRDVHKNTTEAKRIGKESFVHAFVGDQLQAEKERGITMDMAYKAINISGKHIHLLDSPGHSDFVPNMIAGTSQAEYAIFTVDVVPNAFEASLKKGLKEKIYLLKALGIEDVIVAMNKMDCIKWDQKIYQETVNTLNKIFNSIGMMRIRFVPISAFQGQNITQKYKCNWYNDGCLAESIAKWDFPIRNSDKPFRYLITNKFNQLEGKIRGTCLFGKIVSGQVEKGGQYVIMPSGIICKVKDIEDAQTKCGYEGQIIELGIQTQIDQDFQYIKSGEVLCSMDYPIPCSNLLVCEIATLDLEYPLIKGAQLLIHINVNKMPCSLKKIVAVYDENYKIKRQFPRAICQNETALVEIQCEGLICTEIEKNIKELSLFVLRERFKTLALGKVQEIKINQSKLKESKILHEQQI